MVFPTMVGQRELDAVRRRTAKPVMIVDNLSVTRQFDALQRALASGVLRSDTRALEDFLGYKDASGRSQR
jgi:hypothetical protein